MESSYASWHELTLEELIRLTSPKARATSSGRHEKKPAGIPLLLRTRFERQRTIPLGDVEQSHWGDEAEPPPRAEAQDDLNSYVMTKWCPWFSRTFGVLSEGNLNMLTVRLLRVHSDDTPLLLELLATVLLVLKLPNAPRPPSCRDQSLATRFLLYAPAD